MELESFVYSYVYEAISKGMYHTYRSIKSVACILALDRLQRCMNSINIQLKKDVLFELVCTIVSSILEACPIKSLGNILLFEFRSFHTPILYDFEQVRSFFRRVIPKPSKRINHRVGQECPVIEL